MNKRVLASVAAVGVLVAGSVAWAQQSSPPIVREGSGVRRATLDKMELAPFPSAAWSELSDWVGPAFSSNEGKGQVVLICTFSDWYSPAGRAWSSARRLAEAKGKDGLVLVGAFHSEGWDAYKKAAPKSESKDAKIFLAHDAKGGFRKAILSDQDPDFYLIDRAGQLRFADVESESVENAVNLLLAETAEQAAGLKGKIAETEAKADEDFRRSGSIRQRVDLQTLPEVPFTDPTPADYEMATWPKKEKDPNAYSEDNQPKTIQLGNSAVYFPHPPQLKGRAIVIYVWSPELRSSYENIMPTMDRLQIKYGRDVAIIGAAAFNTDRSSSNQPMDPKEAVKKVQQFTTSRSFEHVLTLYNDGMVGNRSGEQTYPFAVVASSNGVIRWSGRPTAPGFLAALEQVMDADPAVKARRAAENEYIKAHAK